MTKNGTPSRQISSRGAKRAQKAEKRTPASLWKVKSLRLRRVRVVHRSVPSHPALADPEFWTWLAISHGLEIIEWRYGKQPDLKNFGVGGLRARISFIPSLAPGGGRLRFSDKADAYELRRFGDIDFWRSHIFRQGYANVRTFARALLEFQFPAAHGRKPYLKIAQNTRTGEIFKKSSNQPHV